MRIIKTGELADKTPIQIEDWFADYPCFAMNSNLVAYPKSKADIPGDFAPKYGKTFRADFSFNSAEECLAAFNALITGQKELTDYCEYLYNKNYTPAVCGR